jgi:hypothetical protein
MNTANNNREPMLQFFSVEHASPLRDVLASFSGLAKQIVDVLPRNPERTVALRKLVEARDCAIRAHAFKAEG